jgi:hypothetical protein
MKIKWVDEKSFFGDLIPCLFIGKVFYARIYDRSEDGYVDRRLNFKCITLNHNDNNFFTTESLGEARKRLEEKAAEFIRKLNDDL